jgi:hypothetical protein
VNRRLSLAELARRDAGPAAQVIEELVRHNPILDFGIEAPRPPWTRRAPAAVRRWIGEQLRRAADRFDPEGEPS